jgi:hypothetical protein
MIYKEDLDGMSCAQGHSSKGLFLHSACHIGAPTWVRYEDGILTICCASCNKVIIAVAVASKIKEGG